MLVSSENNFIIKVGWNSLDEFARLKLTQEQKDDFAMITTFNIKARNDEYKQSFYKNDIAFTLNTIL